MAKLLEETFIHIRDDFNAHKPKGRGSFLYRYLAEGRCREAYEKERDPQKADDIIYKVASDLMYNQGYPLTGKILEKNRKRAHNTMLEMLDAWYLQRGFIRDSAFFPKGRGDFIFSEDFPEEGGNEFDIEAYQILYERLNQEKRTKAFMPVRIDSETGVGFYIIGRDHYVEFPYEDPEQACGIGIISDWMSDSDSDKEDREEDIHLNLTIGSMEDPMDFPSIAEANSWFVNRLYQDAKERFAFFRECNGVFPQGVDKRFKKYFMEQTELEESIDVITEEDKEETKKKFPF